MVRIFVTGAGGQLGLTLQEHAQDFPQFCFDFKTADQLDITQPTKLDDVFLEKHYDFCINCAAYTHVEQAEKHPDLAFKINAEGAKNIAELCYDHNVTLVHISTDYVFDGEKEGPYLVDDRPNPINVYGASKLKGEQFIQKIIPNHFIVRTSWLYNKKHGHNFYRTILNKAKAGEELRITDAQKGCPTNSDALANYILNEIVCGERPFGTYHYTDGEPTTWYGFAQQILKENGLEETANLILDRNYRTLARRPRNSVLAAT
jgi:dTDP-4-dehydrorhamnose reductase